MSESEKKAVHPVDTETNRQEPALQKQYKILVDVYQNETGRFWTRFNIFVGIQFVGLLGILSNLKILAANVVVFRSLMIFCGLLSALVVLIVVRGIMSSRMLIRMIAHLENQSQELMPLVALTRKFDSLPQYVNLIVTLAISALFCLGWWLALIYFEVTSYSIVIPK